MATYTFFTGSAGITADYETGAAATVAVEVFPVVDGWISAIWVRRHASAHTGTRAAAVFEVAPNGSMSQLAGTATSIDLSSVAVGGFARGVISPAVRLRANVRYRIAVHMPVGHGARSSYWSTGAGSAGLQLPYGAAQSDIVIGALSSTDASSQQQGSFAAGSSLAAPTQSGVGRNYWVDLSFVPTTKLAASRQATITGAAALAATQKLAATGEVTVQAPDTTLFGYRPISAAGGLAVSGTALLTERNLIGVGLITVSGVAELGGGVVVSPDADFYAPPREAARVMFPRSTGVRYIAQQVGGSGSVLHWNLPLSEVSVKYVLSGPGVLSAKITPEHRDLVDVGLRSDWSTWVHWELDGEIQASGLITPGSLEGESLAVECEGPSGYAHGLPYDDRWSQIGVDAADIVREIWRHLQSYPDGKLGVTVTGTAGTKYGTAAIPDDSDSGPFLLAWWNNTDCGDEIRRLADAAPFDFIERARWNTAKTDVEHFIDVAPVIGTTRRDLRFVLGENITEQPPLAYNQDLATTVIGLGNGEGSAKVRAVASTVVPGRTRRVATITNDQVRTTKEMQGLVNAELQRRLHNLAFAKITIDGWHDNATFGTFRCGDHIYVQVPDLPYVGAVRLWHRITAIEVDPLSRLVQVDMARSDPAAA